MDDSRAGAAARSRLQFEILLPSGLRAPGLAAWLQSVAPTRARGSVTVAVVSDSRVRALNRDYRRKDMATDVLSFPAHEPRTVARRSRLLAVDRTRSAPRESLVATGERLLGDVVIAAGVARRQAREAGHSVQTELKILALHGLLHLLGYDHERDDGRMARLERRLRRAGGLREGLIERAR